jgi:phosphoglycerol transferase MdoB-like AlkP superfamily enzyme
MPRHADRRVVERIHVLSDRTSIAPASVWQSPKLRFWLICIVLFASIELLDRVTLTVWTAIARIGLTEEFAYGLLTGTIDDLATGTVLGSIFLLGLLVLSRFYRWRVVRFLCHLLLLAMLSGLIFVEFAEMFFWNEFDSRLNGIAVNYLIFPREVIGNIRESFSVGLFLPIVLAIAGLLYLALRRRLSAALLRSTPGETARVAAAGLAAVLLATPLMYYGPLRDSENREAQEIATNGFHSFLRAALTNDEQYDGLYLGASEAAAAAEVRAMVGQDNTRFLAATAERRILRHVDNGAAPKRRLNVVLVIEESFGSIYVDGLDNRTQESTSPSLSRLAQDGLLFTNIYATGNRTVRGLEALLTSFPPIPGISTVRRSGSEGMNSLPFLLQNLGYGTAFLYGGRGTFDNMGHYWSTVGFDAVWDQNDIAEPGFTTIWGVADEYLFGEALQRMDAMPRDRPFFLGLLTVSNHRPYLYPDGRIAKPAKQKRKENAATYADWAFGDFVERARQHPWFDDTVFVFIGDHGPRVYGAAQVPVPSYRVPLLFYAPKHIAAEVNPTLGSSMDMAPTLLGLLGISYDSPFFGIDLRRVTPGHERAVMEHNYSIGIADGHEVAAVLPGKRHAAYTMEPGPKELVPKATADADLLNKVIALTQTAHHMFYAHEYHTLSERQR